MAKQAGYMRSYRARRKANAGKPSGRANSGAGRSGGIDLQRINARAQESRYRSMITSAGRSARRFTGMGLSSGRSIYARSGRTLDVHSSTIYNARSSHRGFPGTRVKPKTFRQPQRITRRRGSVTARRVGLIRSRNTRRNIIAGQMTLFDL